VEILDRLKNVVRLVQASDNLDLVKETLALQSELMGAFETIRLLREENGALRSALDLRKEMKWNKPLGVYFRALPSGDDGPYCPRCFDGAGKIARMAQDDREGTFDCTVCGHWAYMPGRRPPKPEPEAPGSYSDF
jgi:hypothetical protein